MLCTYCLQQMTSVNYISCPAWIFTFFGMLFGEVFYKNFIIAMKREKYFALPVTITTKAASYKIKK